MSKNNITKKNNIRNLLSFFVSIFLSYLLSFGFNLQSYLPKNHFIELEFKANQKNLINFELTNPDILNLSGFADLYNSNILHFLDMTIKQEFSKKNIIKFNENCILEKINEENSFVLKVSSNPITNSYIKTNKLNIIFKLRQELNNSCSIFFEKLNNDFLNISFQESINNLSKQVIFAEQYEKEYGQEFYKKNKNILPDFALANLFQSYTINYFSAKKFLENIEINKKNIFNTISKLKYVKTSKSDLNNIRIFFILVLFFWCSFYIYFYINSKK